MKNGKVVGQGDKLSFESSKNRSGKYWCMARNELGLTINASALLDVQCKFWKIKLNLTRLYVVIREGFRADTES